jgi:capsular polysaccharide export protein
VSGLRKYGANENSALAGADEVVPAVSMSALLGQVDEVHVISSLAGFEALLHGVKVVCHGRPFYAGWGLSEDVDPPPCRTRRLSIDEIVAAALILYPRYLHPRRGYFMSAEEAVDELQSWRLKPEAPLWRRLLLPLLRWRAR